MPGMNLSERIKEKAIQVGFDAAGITTAKPIDADSGRMFSEWLSRGFAARMQYMHRNLEKRLDPALLLPGAKSVICLALAYSVPKPPHAPPDSPRAAVAAYACYQDYHTVIKELLHKLLKHITTLAAGQFQYKICVDSVPFAERAFAERAGLGFIGKNHMLIHPALGPQILLGEIITTIELAPDTPLPHTCVACNRCIDACPTGALRPDGFLDAARCISYLTIEHKDRIPDNLTKKIGSRLFGCDQCILACPFARHPATPRNTGFKFHAERTTLDLHQILSLSKADFDARFADSCIRRLGLQRLKRNARICLQNAQTTD